MLVMGVQMHLKRASNSGMITNILGRMHKAAQMD